ncbi:MAG: ABC transporter ATP-binding protein [Lachnospiraceae bacterium]|jgi:peptide/nickel transport system ATP-binding protein|nr:ABC transporter ATP-binding protein [Lachnospiraceae bacterium]
MSGLLEVVNLKKYFETRGGLLHAVDGVSFSVGQGKVLGVVGESGCGKSTLGRVILGIIDATGGQVIFEGEDITGIRGRKRAELQKKMQIIYQDPYSSLNPRMCVFDLIADPLQANHVYHDAKALGKRVLEAMDTVGLARNLAYSYPHELDGGRRQRIGIARALVLDPTFIVCDEPVSALDVSIQAQILNLLQDLQEQRRLTYIFVTHDLSVVKHISDDILVMYMGCMAEKCPADELFENPLHPYTQGLLASIPVPDVDYHREKIRIKGEITSPIEPKPGCRFAPRCAFADEKCQRETPVFREMGEGHFVACHRAGQEVV